jgi:GntR family transcriptional repressor for pyruvate dehydrogenase complex
VAESTREVRTPRRRPAPVALPGIEPLVTTRLSDDLADRIRGLIISEDIVEGSRLPSERDLAERFGASRPTVSQALRTLSLMGLVEIRRGSGAYVVRRPETMVTASVNLMLDLDQHSVSDLMQLRFWLETVGVQEAATRETVFHATVVRSAGNPYLAAMYEGVHTAVLSYEFKQWVDSESVPAWLRDAGPEEQLALHEPIVASIAAQDPDAARTAVVNHHRVMLEHLDAARALHDARRA